MIRTQIQLPDDLYAELKFLAERQEWSLAETIRRGAEYIISVYPKDALSKQDWTPPEPLCLGAFSAEVEEWREMASISSES